MNVMNDAKKSISNAFTDSWGKRLEISKTTAFGHRKSVDLITWQNLEASLLGVPVLQKRKRFGGHQA